jgi:tetratricopeptide (TPR) repeat protein
MMGRRFTLCMALAACCASAAFAFTQPDSDDATNRYAAAGQRALAAGDYAEAQSDFEKLAKLEPKIAEVHATLAVIDFKLREYERAVGEVRVAQNLNPKLPKLDTLLSMAQAELGRFVEALPGLEKGFKQQADAEVRRMCGLQLLRAYTGLHRDPDAVETALALNRLYPDDPEILYNTGRIFGNFAYVVMEKLHDTAPGSIWMLQAAGEANESQKAYDAAITAFNAVLSRDPNRPNIHYRLGRTYLARFEDTHKPEDRESASREFAAELEMDPANGNAAYELAQIDAETGKLPEAKSRFEQVLAHFPDFEQALVGLGRVYVDTGDYAKAVASLEQATRLNANDEVGWYRLSQAQRLSGNRDEAQKSLEVFRRLHASPTVALKAPTGNEVSPQQLGQDVQP